MDRLVVMKFHTIRKVIWTCLGGRFFWTRCSRLSDNSSPGSLPYSVTVKQAVLSAVSNCLNVVCIER